MDRCCTLLFFCTSGGAVCAGYAQVTLVELRVSYRSGCDQEESEQSATGVALCLLDSPDSWSVLEVLEVAWGEG